MWLAAFKLEFETREPERARALLAKARGSEHSATRRVWMKSAVVERELGNTAEVWARPVLLKGPRAPSLLRVQAVMRAANNRPLLPP